MTLNIDRFSSSNTMISYDLSVDNGFKIMDWCFQPFSSSYFLLSYSCATSAKSELKTYFLSLETKISWGVFSLKAP